MSVGVEVRQDPHAGGADLFRGQCGREFGQDFLGLRPLFHVDGRRDLLHHVQHRMDVVGAYRTGREFTGGVRAHGWHFLAGHRVHGFERLHFFQTLLRARDPQFRLQELGDRHASHGPVGVTVGDLEDPLVTDGLELTDNGVVVDRQLCDGLVVVGVRGLLGDLGQKGLQSSIFRHEIAHEPAPSPGVTVRLF
ncbi:MAG: hypothetical protein NTW76_04845 [Corynebacteriales bacterium]|nr:hypothetical protein [Mycobacteriales bacterium]